MMSSDPDKLAPDALNWAITHIQKYGDTDIFPIPFEYHCIQSSWNHILAELKEMDFSTHEVKTSLRQMVPKHLSGFRTSTQLDPLDCILFNAAVFECAREIEQFRVPKREKTACSFRLDIKTNGQLFQADTGWPDFHQQSLTLCSKARTKFVLCADIVDFYNHASHHRIQNTLQSAGVSDFRSKSIERFLANLTALHHSRGVPVGPYISILLTELCLTDVDNFLIRKNYKHTRYVDDFRFFCKSEEMAINLLHDLSEYLYTAHRLSLQNDKTEIWSAEDFQINRLLDPEEQEMRQFQDSIAELVKALNAAPYGDTATEDDIDEKEKKKAARKALKTLLGEIVNVEPLNIGIARYVLRRSAHLRTREIMKDVLENIEFLLPVLRDVVNYCVRAHDRKNPRVVGDALVELALKSNYKCLPFIHYWVVDALCRVPEFATASKAMAVAESSDQSIRDRLCALVAQRYQIVDWVRGRKEDWQNSPPWGQRAIVWASSILPNDEKGHWLKPIKNYPDLLISTVARSVM